ncbi:MAG: hypothetical protein CXZ00_07590 [Acidobacteria bacterium]|nr:MAG: hypothetical protein CXZ00_07590 [Acidobacteriota bacterium]
MRGQRILAELFVDLRAGDGDGERFLDFNYNARRIKTDSEIPFVISAGAVGQFLSASSALEGVGSAQQPHGILTASLTNDQSAKTGWLPGGRRGEEGGCKQEQNGG